MSLRLVLNNPTLPENTGDHRYAARSLQHIGGRARERLRYHPATPLAGTRSTTLRIFAPKAISHTNCQCQHGQTLPRISKPFDERVRKTVSNVLCRKCSQRPSRGVRRAPNTVHVSCHYEDGLGKSETLSISLEALDFLPNSIKRSDFDMADELAFANCVASELRANCLHNQDSRRAAHTRI